MSTATRRVPPYAATLPGHYYVDPAIYALEQEKIFATTWVCVGRADAVAATGQFLNVALAGESVLIVRGRDGVVRAMLNVCRHRGARLCTADQGQLPNSLQCKYHAWTYGLDGTLLGAPNALNDEGFDRTQFGLVPVALEEWHGLLWANLAEQPAPLATVLDPLIERRFGSLEAFGHYNMGSLVVGATITYDVASNWKLIHENFMECYHCGPMHPELCDLLPAYRSGQIFDDGAGAPFGPGVEAFSVSGKASRPPLPGLLPEERNRYVGLEILPNVLLNMLSDHVLVHMLYPQGPGRTRIVCDWLFDAEEAARPGFDPSDVVEIFDLVNRQDWEVCELTWQGSSSRAYRQGGIYVSAEQHIRAMCDWVVNKLDG